MIYHIYANQSNIGDWLSAIGIQSLLAREPITELFCDAPFVADTLAALAVASKGDAVVVGGGGLFMDYFTPFWEGMRAIVESVPTYLWGVGYCDLKSEPSRVPTILLAEIVARSRLCFVRDELTRSYLASCKLPDPVPCPSLCTVDPPEPAGHALLHVDNYTTAGAAAFDVMDATGRQFAAQTGRPYLRTNNRIQPGSRDELKATLERYAQADLILSSALHGCVLGLAMGRKVLAVSGDTKIESFMQAAGLGDWVLDIDELGRLQQSLVALPEQPPRPGFVLAARQANTEIAARIRAELMATSNLHQGEATI